MGLFFAFAAIHIVKGHGKITNIVIQIISLKEQKGTNDNNNINSEKIKEKKEEKIKEKEKIGEKIKEIEILINNLKEEKEKKIIDIITPEIYYYTKGIDELLQNNNFSEIKQHIEYLIKNYRFFEGIKDIKINNLKFNCALGLFNKEKNIKDNEKKKR